MIVGLYMDVHVPMTITEGLRRRGVDVLTSQEDGTRRATDEQLLQRSTQLHRVLFTQDEGFLKLAPKWQSSSKFFSGIAFASQMGTSIGRIIDDLELLIRCSTEEEIVNRVTHLPIR